MDLFEWISVTDDLSTPFHDDLMHYWTFVREIRWLLVDSSHKGPAVRNFHFIFDVNRLKL